MLRSRTCFTLLVVVALATDGSSQSASTVRELSEQEMVDMMVGSSIQASRSSNSEAMIKRVKEAFAQGRRFTMIAVNDLPAHWTVGFTGIVGGGGAWQHVVDRTTRQRLATVESRERLAVAALRLHTGREINALMRPESAGATLTTFLIASELHLPVVDACIPGRARPEMSQSTAYINGIPAAPMAMVSRWGDTLLLDRAVDDYRVEDLGRALAVASGGSIAVAGRMMTAEQVRRGAIHGSVSQAILFGRTVREARERGHDPIEALVSVSSGFKLFHGIVARSDQKGEGGFSWADVELKGVQEYEGRIYKVFVKNENIVTWLDGVPDAMAPDFIANLDPTTGDAITGPGLGAYSIGSQVAMVGIPASPLWRTPKGIEIFGPRHFGFDFDYVPVEELYRRREKR